MKYISTRGDRKELSFEDTVLAGLAPDGGLYIPTSIPSLPVDWETEWKELDFVALALEVLSLYIDPKEISREELAALLKASYSSFRHPEVTPFHKLNDKTIVLELFHGPTFAFKDVALQFLGNLFEFFLKRKNDSVESSTSREKLTVLGATSGDTGSAAIYGLRGKADISIFILHPKGRVSPIQEAQMTTVLDANVHNIAVKGTFDDCQDIVKALFGDRVFNDKHKLGAVNSINWARILAQTVYYVYAYLNARKSGVLDGDKKLQFVVPTGNFGDVLAGYYAKRMGVPMEKLVVATNSNDILARFWASGKYEKADSSAAQTSPNTDSGVRETLSPAMDILVSSNFERLLWYLAYEDAGYDRSKASATVKGWMDSVKSNGRCEVPVSALEAARRVFLAERISDVQTLETIRYAWEKYHYVSDPHTAVGLGAARLLAPNNSPNIIQVVLSTAHPAKFSEAVAKALADDTNFNFGRDVLPPEFIGLLDRQRRVIEVDSPSIDKVKKVIEEVAERKE